VAASGPDLAETLAARPERLTLKRSSGSALAEGGDSRSYGASLGTVPDFAGDGKPGVLISAVRPGSPAEKAGIERGDRLVELAGTAIRDLYDMTFVLRQAKPGQSAKAVLERGGKRVELSVVFAAGGQR
jgi:aminopeptidase YwaD